MNNWEHELLGNLCSLITDGKHGDCTNEDDSGFYFISAKDIRDGQICYEGARQITENDFIETHRRTDLKPGDILLTNSGTIGRMAVALDDEITRRTTFQKSVAILKPINDRVITRFLYYLLLGSTSALENAARGSAQKNLLLSELRKFVVCTPPIEVQLRIADLLSTYDRLIENNRRRLSLLEEAARLLYQEWFVHLRFPGHEHTTITNGLPEGWEKRTVHDAFEILSGGTPKTTTAEFWDGDIPFYTPKDAAEGAWVTRSERAISEKGLKNCNSKLYPKETLFITARGTVGKLNLAQRPMAMSQSCYALIAREPLSQVFAFCAMRSAVEELRRHAVGAVFDAIIVDTFKRISLLVPESIVLSLFEELLRPIFNQLENLTLQNEKLRSARDLLLPRLMSGEIEV